MNAAALALAAALAATPPTFHEDVQPILQAKCATCHRPGEVAPFPLLTYEDAAKRARQIGRVTGSRFMPPWKPVPGWGELRDVRRLTDAEIAVINAWYEAGTPRGDPAKAPPPPQFPSGWQLGTPDLVVKMTEPFQVYASGEDIVRAFVIPLPITEDHDVVGVEFRPGNRRVTHHALIYVDNSGEARKRDAADPGPGYKSVGGPGFRPAGSLGGWVPGSTPHFYPEGVGTLLPRGGDVVVQVHYHPDGKPEVDQSELGLFFAKAPQPKRLMALPMVSPKLEIPAGEAHYVTSANFTTPVDIELIAAAPHMHYLGRTMKLWATRPDGVEEKLIAIDDWSFNWQGSYQFQRPLRLPKGSVIHLEATYDNSADNPNQPSNPPKAVTWGEQTTDEMCLAYLSFATPDQNDRWVLLRSMAVQLDLFKLRDQLRGKAR
jgi:copper type II ascorbate-dependent monooxygenase-like protein